MTAYAPDERFDLQSHLLFLGLYAGTLLVFWAGVSPVALWVTAGLTFIRLFTLWGGYHMYFAHRAFKTGRVFQFLLAAVGATNAQNGPLWWASMHRVHHRHADTEEDPHPVQRGFWWTYAGWVLSRKNLHTREEEVGDFSRFPELVWLDRYHYVASFILIGVLFAVGTWLNRIHPDLGTSGLQMAVWGYFIGTVVIQNALAIPNALVHRFGTRRFDTPDDSRNCWWLALVTMGEWHNNHHAFPSSARRGIAWWEIDPTFMLIKGLALIGLVWDVREPPANARQI